jgi:hypothetical protein
MAHVILAITASPMAYCFQTLPSGVHHELALFSLVSCSQVIGVGHVSYPASPELALSDLLKNCLGFVGIHHVCIEAGQFVIYFGMSCFFFCRVENVCKVSGKSLYKFSTEPG